MVKIIISAAMGKPLQEFFDKDKHPHAYVHCTSEAQVIKLTHAFHEMGQHWSGGQKYRDETYWYCAKKVV